MRREGQGSASISAVVVFLSALLALGLMATILPPVANVLSGFREGLRERGERGSELIRIYIHTANETENEPPIITIINGYDKESILTDYVVVARDGRILAAGKMGGSLGGIRIPAGARIDLTPADFGLSYGSFAAMADEVKAIYIRTAEGNSFGSSYGPPPKVSVDYQIKMSQNAHHILVFGSTTTIFNYTISGKLPKLGKAMIVKNILLVHGEAVRGGVMAGSKWSDGTFDPNQIPDQLAEFTRNVDFVPIGGYYAVPYFPLGSISIRHWDGVQEYYDPYDAYYIEMIMFYPVEFYTPTRRTTLELVHWLRRYLGPGYEIAAWNVEFPIKVPSNAPYVAEAQGHILKYVDRYYKTYFATFERYPPTTYTTTTTWTRTYTTSYRTTVTTTRTTTYTIPDITTTYITTYTITIRYTTTIWTIITTTSTVTSTITTLRPIIITEQIKSAVIGGNLSGNFYIHYGGGPPLKTYTIGQKVTVVGDYIKINAPLILINYIYKIREPQPPPQLPPNPYLNLNIDEGRMICENYERPTLPPPSESSGDSSGTSASSPPQPAQSTSGGTVPDVYTQTQTQAAMRGGYCRPAFSWWASPN
jgi:hypothetical protein